MVHTKTKQVAGNWKHECTRLQGLDKNIDFRQHLLIQNCSAWDMMESCSASMLPSQSSRPVYTGKTCDDIRS